MRIEVVWGYEGQKSYPERRRSSEKKGIKPIRVRSDTQGRDKSKKRNCGE